MNGREEEDHDRFESHGNPHGESSKNNNNHNNQDSETHSNSGLLLGDEDDDNDNNREASTAIPDLNDKAAPFGGLRPPGYKAVYESSSDEEELSPEEIQILEEENAKLFEKFMSVKDTVQQVENKVVKIAELQNVFSEKVLAQKDDIDLISENAVKSTENVKDGNEELRKAIQNQASVRVYVLFFLLVMSFSLLFLDWYNE